MEQAQQMTRRSHDAQLMERVVAACAVPGAVVAKIGAQRTLD